MAQVRDYNKLAHDIIREVGGAQNIVNATRCATRFRLVLKETPAGAKEKISELPGVITVVENNGQFQVVIGTHVGDVYAAAAEILHLDENMEEVEQPKQSVVNRIIATMSAVFAPFVYILAAAGQISSTANVTPTESTITGATVETTATQTAEIGNRVADKATNTVIDTVAVKTVDSPLIGQVIPLSEVNDPVFSSEAMGKGCAVIPSEGKVFAPFDGTIVGLLDSHHAVGMESKNGIEILIHVGMDTVKLGGKHFTCHIEDGQQVKKGQLLLEFDMNAIKAEGYEVVTPVIITNSDEFTEITTETAGQVKNGDKLLKLM